MIRETFTSRHIGPSVSDRGEMLKTIGVENAGDLINQTVPPAIRLEKEMQLNKATSEYEYANRLRKLAGQNQVFKSFIGMGYYGTIVPPVISRNILENPGWYTAYTPYQAEISQGRLEALLNFQTMVSDMTGMPLANASLLDEGTAAAEAMIMLYNTRKGARKKTARRFFADRNVFAQTINVLKTRAEPLGIELVIGDWNTFSGDDSYFGALIQYPNAQGEVQDYRDWTERMHELQIGVVVAADILSLALLTPPGEWDADVVVGTTQRLGIPMGLGGPHAAYFATHESYKRNLPGRVIGISVDRHGNPALRMALQTREQHIRRDKATSNICTAQALLAIMAGMYAVYHGPKGIRKIAELIHAKTCFVADTLKKAGWKVNSRQYFDTLWVETDTQEKWALLDACLRNRINVFSSEGAVGISLDEAATPDDIQALLDAFHAAKNLAFEHKVENEDFVFDTARLGNLTRTTDYLIHPIFSKYHSETEMMRYLKRLENKDISLTHSMISLGSCTMKLNAASELDPISWPEFANLHPFAPADQLTGYTTILQELSEDLAEITGFAAVSLQPNSGAQGEYAGLLVIRAYHQDRGEGHRNICLIPSSAHGTNPASAVMAGMQVVVVKCDDQGNIDVADLQEKAEKHGDNLAAIMVTYPSTHGVFEEEILEITRLIHDCGGLVYMDGANMNAQVGLTNPGRIGADVCHLNLHKTFAIPHGGGGPGMGPIAVNEKLAPYLPGHIYQRVGGEKAIPAISSAPWGSASILIISHAYIRMLGTGGLTESTVQAIMNANYIKARLEGQYSVLFTGKKNRVAHEMIVDLRPFKASAGIEAEDVAKRLIDYGFHAPTLSFPVAGTIMIEPTESESKEELDRFCNALLSIRAEIGEIETGIADREDNVLKNAPHTARECIAETWPHPYSREKASYPLSYIQEAKYWPPVGRVDNAYGDRNLVCTCPSPEEYEALMPS